MPRRIIRRASQRAVRRGSRSSYTPPQKEESAEPEAQEDFNVPEETEKEIEEQESQPEQEITRTEPEESDHPVSLREEPLEEEPEKKRTIRVLPYIFLIFGLSSFSFFVMSTVLILIPYYIIDQAAYPIIIVVSLLLAFISYWVITRATTSHHAVAWAGLTIPLLPLAAIIFLQKVFIALAQHKKEIMDAINRNIPDLFAPLFDTAYPLPIIISIIFYAFFSFIFFIFLIRKKSKAGFLYLLTPFIFIGLWFLLQPLIDQTVLAWVAYFKSL